MDSTAGYDPTLPLDLDGSCNPGLLPEVTFSNHLEFSNGNIPLIGKQNSGRMSPVRGTTMKEYDQIISELRKENFSLKLRIYFLEERMQQKYGDGDDIFKTNIELRVEVESLKKELADKQDLLKKASLAMENLTANHQLELQQVKGQVELELKTQHHDLAEKYNQSLVESDNYQHNLEESEKRVLELENQLESIQQELEETKSNQMKDCQQLNEALKTVQDKQSDINQLEDLLKKNEEERRNEKEKYEGMEKGLAEEMKQMKKHIERKERDIQNISTIVDKTNSSFNYESFLAPTHLQDAMEDQKETVKNLQIKLRENQKKLSDKTDMVAELEDQLYQLERDNKEINRKSKLSGREIEKLQEGSDKRDKTIQSLVLALHGKSKEELANKISQSEAASKIQEENTFKRDKTIQGFIVALNKKDKEVTALSDKLKEKEIEVEKFSEELHKVNIDHNKTVTEISEDQQDKTDKITFLENQLKTSSEDMEKLLKSLGQKDGKLVEFKEMLVKAEKAMKNSEAALEGLQDQLNQEKQDGQSRADNLAQHYQTLLDDLQNQVKNKEKLLHQLTERLKDKDRQLHDCFNLLDTEHLQSNGSNPVDLLKKLQQKLKDKDLTLENQDREWSRDLDNKENEIRSLKQSLRQKEQDLSQANHMLLSVEDKAERLEREVKDREEKLSQLANCLQTAQKSFDDAMDNHVRAIEQKSNMINRLKESIDARESALQESMENSPGLSTDQVKKLKQQLRAKETTIQELLNEKNELMGQHEKTSRDFFNKIKLKDREYKTLQEKENKERNNLEKELQQLQTDVNKRDLEIQRLESGSQWAEDQLDKLRESLKEKDKTIEALFESGKEKDKLLQQAQQTRSPSVSSSVTDMAHIQSLQDEIAFLLNHVASKDSMINQLRSKSESSPWQQKEIDRLSDELMKKSDALKSSKHTEGRLESQLADLKRRVSELESQQSGQHNNNSQLYDLIRDQLSELKSLGDILRTERQLYINLNQTDTQHNSSSGNREIDRELEKIVKLREKLEAGVERNNTLRIVLEQQQATKPYNTDQEKLNEEVKTSKKYYDKYLTNSPNFKKQQADKNTSPLKLKRVPVQTQTEISANLDQDSQKLGNLSLLKFTEGEGDSLNLLSKTHLDSVDNSDFLHSQHKFCHLAERPSELTNFHNQCFGRISSGYGDTRELGCEHYASSEASTNETTGLNPHETVLTSNRKFHTVHSPPQLLQKEELSKKGQGQRESPAVLPSNVLIDNQKVHIVSPHKVSFLDNSVFASENPNSSIHSPPHILRHHTNSSHLSSHPQSITHIDSTKDHTESVTSDLHRDLRPNSLSDVNELSLPEVDIDRLSVDQSVLLSEDISNMSAQSLRKLVSKLQDSLIDSLQENQNLKDQVRESIGSRQIPGRNESDPTPADLQVMQQKMDQLQSQLSKTHYENESLKKQCSPRLSNSENDVVKLKEKLAKVENNNQLLKKQIILNTKSSSAPSGFNPELIVEMANEIERLKKVVAETKLNASDSDVSENSTNGCLAQDGTASPKGNKSKARSTATVEETSSEDLSEQNVQKNAPKIPNTASHIPKLRKPSDSKKSKLAPLVVIHDQTENDPSVLNSLLEAARSSIKQLEEKLAATEDTVRFQSSKMKYYRGLATDAGLIPKMSSRSQSETNLSKLSKNPSIKTSSCENLTDFNENGSISTDESKEYGKTENVTALKMQIDELINKLQRQTLEINNLKTKSFNRTCRSLSPPNVSPRIKELKDQLRESAQQNSGKEFVSSSKLSPLVDPQTIPEQDYIQNLKIRFPENEKLRNSAERNFRWRSPSPSSQKSLDFSGRNFKSRSQSDIDSLEGKNNQELLEQCRGLKEELAEVKHDNSILAARLVELGGNNQRQLPAETLTNQLKNLEEEKKQLEINLQKANSRIEDFETEIRSYRFEKMRLEKSLLSGEQKIKWLQQDKNLSETDQELLLVRQQLHDSQNTCLQLRNQLEEISCFLTELISQDNQSDTNSTVSGARFDKIKQHLKYSKDVIDASLSDVSRIDERSRLDEVDHVTGSKYQSAVDEINKLQKELNLQEARSQEQLAEKDAEISNLRDEIETVSRHGVPEGCDSDIPSSHRSISSDHQLSPHSINKSSKASNFHTDRRICLKPGETRKDFSVEQIRQRFTSGQTDISSVTGVTDLTSDPGSYTKNSTVLVGRSPLNHRGGYTNTSFRDRGDNPNDISRKGGNLSGLYFSKMDDSDFLLSESHFCNQSNGSIFGGRHGEALLDSSDTRSKASDDTLSHVSSFKERSVTPTGSEIITLKSRLSVVEELNQTLKAEISMYENIVQTDNQRTPQNRSFQGQFSHRGQDELHDHLAEIRALRLRLEKSLDECEKLQIQLEERLGESQEDERMKYEDKIQELNNLISELRSKLSQSETIIKEKITIIEEKEKTLYKTKVILEKNNQKLAESDVQFSEIQKRLSKSEKFRSELENNYSILKNQNTELLTKCSVIENRNSELEQKCSLFENSKIDLEKRCSLSERKCSEMEKQRQQMEVNRQQMDHHYEKFQQRKEKQEAQLKKAGKEIKKLQQEILLWKERAEEKAELNKTLKLELSMHEKIQCQVRGGDQINIDISDLLTEVRHLRIQLERCIDTNNRLRQTIEGLLHQQLKQSKHQHSPSSSTASDAADGRPSPQNSPYKSPEHQRKTVERETYIHRKTREDNYEYDFEERNSHDHRREDGRTENGFRSSVYDQSGGPRYKIESSNQKEPGSKPTPTGDKTSRFMTSIPNCCPNPNTSIHSLPSDLDRYFDKERSIKYWVDTATYREVPHVDVDSDIRRLFAIGKLDDFEKIRKENEEELSVLCGLEARVQDRINTVRRTTEQSVEYSTLKEIALAIENLRICMDAEGVVIKRFWISQLPPVNELGEFYDAKLAEDNRILRKELAKAKSEVDLVKHSARNAEQRLRHTTRQRQGMEDAICQQLTRTNKILQQASDNFKTSNKVGPYLTPNGALYLDDLKNK